MLKVACISLLFITATAADLRAQQSQPSSPVEASVATDGSAAAPSITSALTGVSYLIETRAPRAGVRPVSTRTVTTPETTTSVASLTPQQRGIVEKLNRVDGSRVQRLSTVVVPATWVDDELAYSPFPQTYGWAADKPKALVVDQSGQAFAAYEYGRLVRWGPVSTGEGGKTPSGLFNLSWRSRGHRSSVDPAWYLEWYFNFIPSRGIAFHKYSLPGQAASHGCVRMLERDAQWLYEWGEAKNTAVLVLNCPDATKPWQSSDFLTRGISLPDNPDPRMTSCSGYSGAALATHRKAIR